MRKIFTLLLLVAGYNLAAQQYNNEWIEYNQTYYKFKVAKAGVYRIPKSVLDAAGIGNTQVQFFELWRNGEKVPFYPSVPSGVLPADGYLEFWGMPNDGKPDKALYRDPDYQHTDKTSLLTDTAMYFLSVNTNQSGNFINEVVNNVAGNVLPAETYFMYTRGQYYTNRINEGFAAVIGEYVYSSSYDKGEFHSSGLIRPSITLSTNLANLFVYAAGPASSLRFGAAGAALNPRTIRVSVNGTEVKDTLMDYFNDVHTTVPIPTSLIATGNIPVQFNNTSPIGSDRMVVSYFELKYPRQFNFGAQKSFEFELPAKPEGYFLKITNFNDGGIAPLLYDLANGERYVGDKSQAGMVQFALPGSAVARKLVIVNITEPNINTVSTLTARNFIRYDQAANQGDYIIISNSILYNGTTGNNPIIDYKNYRESPAGGSHKVIVAEIDQLVDQFAFGIKKHPLSVRNFLRYARSVFSPAPRFVFVIGRGVVYNEYYHRQHTADIELLNLVPTFGYPGSDNLLATDDLTRPIAAIPIGRLSVVNGQEVENYLEKVIEYEAAQQNSAATLADRAWMKNVVHVTGSSDPYLGNVLCHYVGEYKKVIEDSLFGGKVTTFCKTSTNPVEQLNSGRLEELFAEGISVLTYFGHSSSTTLEFNIEDPNAYSNPGKYPVFYVNGCNAGNFFTYSPGRLIANETLSEKFTLAKQRGVVAFVASTHYGIVNYLNVFLSQLYKTISYYDYGKSIGEINRNALQRLLASTGTFDYYARSHAEQITLHGDPAITINGQVKPDFVVEESSIHVEPVFVSVAEDFFTLTTEVANVGKVNGDSVVVEIKRQYPDGSIEVIYNDKWPDDQFVNSFTLEVPVVPFRDKGRNRIIVSVDPVNAIDEMAETNNSAIREVFVYEDEVRPVYPYNYSIIKIPTQKLYASTANPLAEATNAIMEIDTTEAFNSPLKVTKTINSEGGVLEFDPGISYLDSVVYYWRTAPLPGSGSPLWKNASFTYIPDQEGFNQSHHYQHTGSTHERVFYDTSSRQWKYGRNTQNIYAVNTIYPTGGRADADFAVSVNDITFIMSACLGRSLLFNVFDSVSFKPWKNVDENGNNLYRFGSASANCKPSRNYNFEFSYMTPASRKLIMDFMDSIPNGSLVVVRSTDHNDSNSYSYAWRGDTALYGNNNSLYHKLLYAGFTEIDSINKPRAWVFVYKKGDYRFVPQYAYTDSIFDRVTVQVDITTPDTLGYITSPKFGPARSWKNIVWSGTSNEDPSTDNVSIQVLGVDTADVEVPLFELDKYTQNADISFVDAAQYPYLRLRMRNGDSVNLTPLQLKYWRVLYDPVPEGSLAGNVYLLGKDTLEAGEIFNFSIAFKNISPYSFDSIAVKVTVLDHKNLLHTIQVPKQRPIVSGDTIIVRIALDTKNFAGNNVLFVEVNPYNDQPEQQHFNNILYKSFYVRLDKTSPLLDVTFDGRHILNGDIVSATPHIQIKLKDDAKYLLLNDTALTQVQIKYPDGTFRTYNFDGDTLRFTPAATGDDNTATIDFNPAFLTQVYPEGDDYELIVKGKDRSNNQAGEVEYRVAFQVITRPMISNFLNYPNPFSSSTAFVFTITGSEIPQNIKIQILTVTGKIVREITRQELGPLHIGRNITEFKWDGTDQYGQKLGNGVYLYRVVTTMNGKPMEKYKAEGDNTDQYFTNGYGKMYLMR